MLDPLGEMFRSLCLTGDVFIDSHYCSAVRAYQCLQAGL
jgi:hypothetical protein